ncbi:DUF998 domain-containing protein [Nonomuraea mesophila]|uniref:DUF998 domain-containing protein n=1 Tax=Nonomuraea mesophila TaxID=2530382 RepID=UPI001FE5DA79|nr:DUF998 domain-containing protein [Nonomuraea mesophila]
MNRPVAQASAVQPTTPSGTTRLFLLAGTVAGPLFAIVALAQAVLREGFNPLRHAVSQLSLGEGGWVQVANFAVTGLLMLACAIGLRRVLRGGRGGRWAPVLIAVMGVGFVVAALLPADPGNGFPPGTGSEAAFSVTGMLHLACAGIAFIALIAACFVLASRFSGMSRRGWAITGRTSGVLLAIGFAAANSGVVGGPLAMFVGVIIAWLWVGVSAARLVR